MHDVAQWICVRANLGGNRRGPSMRLFPPELKIEPTEGFSKEKDLFERADIGRGLSNLIGVVEQPLVVAVDGQWGSGKTVFLKMWAGELRKKRIPVVYFDAFENDYSEDAFTAIAAELVELTAKAKKAQTKTAKTFVKSAVRASRVVLRSGLKLGVKAVTVGALQSQDLQEIGEDLANELSGLSDKYLGELITKSDASKSVIQAFRDALAELPSLLVDAEEGSARQPLVIIIDELDRCRPVFALNLLERIKHFKWMRCAGHALEVMQWEPQTLSSSLNRLLGFPGAEAPEIADFNELRAESLGRRQRARTKGLRAR